MVRRSPTNHRLGKRMDHLRTTTRSYQSQDQMNDGKDPYRHVKPAAGLRAHLTV
jgi:hypothetical protein